VQTLSPVGATESGVGRVPEDATCGTQRDGQPFRSGARTVCVCAQPERWTQAGLGGSLSMRRQRAGAHRPATRTRRAAGIPTTCSCAAAAAPARSCCRCSPTWSASVATTARSAPPDDTTRRTRRQLHEPRRPADRPTAVVSLTAQQVLLVNAPLGGRMVAPRRSTSAGDASLSDLQEKHRRQLEITRDLAAGLPLAAAARTTRTTWLRRWRQSSRRR
jgi:hypothetical protein